MCRRSKLGRHARGTELSPLLMFPLSCKLTGFSLSGICFGTCCQISGFGARVCIGMRFNQAKKHNSQTVLFIFYATGGVIALPILISIRYALDVLLRLFWIKIVVWPSWLPNIFKTMQIPSAFHDRPSLCNLAVLIFCGFRQVVGGVQWCYSIW